MPSRRAVLAGLAACLLPTPAFASARRVAAIDWGALETALALGIVPLAATELMQFRSIAVEPEVPAGVADLGLRGAPNLEFLAALRPDLILISNFYERQRANLARIGSVLSLSIHATGQPPYALAERAARTLGAATGRESQAEAAIAAARAELEGLRARVRFSRPVFVVSLGDARHFRAFGGDSLFGDVLERLGGVNAWEDPSAYSSAAPVGIEALARVPEADLAIVAPTPPEAARDLAESQIWAALPMVRAGRVAYLPPIDHFGALPAALRFARALVAAHG
jgi:ferric hydroxamate transport system substrate-binding protein